MAAMAKEARAAGVRVRAGIQTAFGCAYEGEVSQKKVVDLVRQTLDMGIDELALSDSTGMANPLQIEQMISEVRPLAGDVSHRLAPARHARAGARQRLRGAPARRDPFRHRLWRARRLPLYCWGERQHRHRGHAFYDGGDGRQHGSRHRQSCGRLEALGNFLRRVPCQPNCITFWKVTRRLCLPMPNSSPPTSPQILSLSAAAVAVSQRRSRRRGWGRG